MARGYVLESELGRREFSALPIRIGRNALNDLSIASPIVSAFHARIEEVDGVIGVVDLNSRNGVYVHPAKGEPTLIPPSTLVNLASVGNMFLLGPAVWVRFEILEGGASQRDFSGSVLGNKHMLEDRASNRPHGSGAHPPVSVPPPRPIQAMPMLDPSRPGGGYQRPHEAVRASAPPPAVYPQLDPGRATNNFNLSLADLALTGLQELAASLFPHQRLTTTGDVARLITRLHDAMEVFCRCFIPLREGHTQFVSNLDLQREATQRRQHRSSGYARVEYARTAEEVAAALLDFKDPSQDSAAAIEGIFADLMVHQVALLDGVLQGVRALLDELSPDGIEEAVDDNATALSRTLGRHRALWQEFRARFEELSGEKQAFQRIFGPEFATVYQQHGKKRDT